MHQLRDGRRIAAMVKRIVVIDPDGQFDDQYTSMFWHHQDAVFVIVQSPNDVLQNGSGADAIVCCPPLRVSKPFLDQVLNPDLGLLLWYDLPGLKQPTKQAIELADENGIKLVGVRPVSVISRFVISMMEEALISSHQLAGRLLEPYDKPRLDLASVTVGLVGMDPVAEQLLEDLLVRGLPDEQALWWDLERKPKHNDGIKIDDLEQLLRSSDVVSLYLPDTQSLNRWFDHEKLTWMELPP